MKFMLKNKNELFLDCKKIPECKDLIYRVIFGFIFPFQSSNLEQSIKYSARETFLYFHFYFDVLFLIVCIKKCFRNIYAPHGAWKTH